MKKIKMQTKIIISTKKNISIPEYKGVKWFKMLFTTSFHKTHNTNHIPHMVVIYYLTSHHLLSCGSLKLNLLISSFVGTHIRGISMFSNSVSLLIFHFNTYLKISLWWDIFFLVITDLGEWFFYGTKAFLPIMVESQPSTIIRGRSYAESRIKINSQ